MTPGPFLPNKDEEIKMNIYVIWSDWDGLRIDTFATTVEGRENAQNFIVALKKLDNGTTLDKVIQGVEMKVEDVEVVSKVKLSVKMN